MGGVGADCWEAWVVFWFVEGWVRGLVGRGTGFWDWGFFSYFTRLCVLFSSGLVFGMYCVLAYFFCLFSLACYLPISTCIYFAFSSHILVTLSPILNGPMNFIGSSCNEIFVLSVNSPCFSWLKLDHLMYYMRILFPGSSSKECSIMKRAAPVLSPPMNRVHILPPNFIYFWTITSTLTMQLNFANFFWEWLIFEGLTVFFSF